MIKGGSAAAVDVRHITLPMLFRHPTTNTFQVQFCLPVWDFFSVCDANILYDTPSARGKQQ